MTMSSRSMLVFAAISGLVFVALGPLGAHVLGGTIGPNEIGLGSHSSGISGLPRADHSGVGGRMQSRVSLWFYWCGRCWRLGTVLFSGSLCCLALLHLKICVYIIPVGGVCFLIGWVLMLVGALRLRTEAGCHE